MADFTGGPGLAAFIATFAVVLAVIILFRSLNKHLRKVRTHPPADEQQDASAALDSGTAASVADQPEGPAAETPDDATDTETR